MSVSSVKGDAEESAYNAKNICITLMVIDVLRSRVVSSDCATCTGKSKYNDGVVHGFQFGTFSRA